MSRRINRWHGILYGWFSFFAPLTATSTPPPAAHSYPSLALAFLFSAFLLSDTSATFKLVLFLLTVDFSSLITLFLSEDVNKAGFLVSLQTSRGFPAKNVEREEGYTPKKEAHLSV